MLWLLTVVSMFLCHQFTHNQCHWAGAGGSSSHPSLKDSFSAVDMTTEKLVAEVLHSAHAGGGPTSSGGGGGATGGGGGYMPPGSPRLGMGGAQIPWHVMLSLMALRSGLSM